MLLKLACFSLAKTFAAVIMFANLGYGQDIVPLFTLIFNAIEVVLQIILIRNLFEAIYYLGQRSDGTRLLSTYRIFGIRFSPEKLKTLSIAFAIFRALVSFLPELCLLTYTDEMLIYTVRRTYPLFMIISLGVSLLFGIIFFIIAKRYVKSLKGGTDIITAAKSMAGEEKLKRIDLEVATEKKTKLLTLLAVSSFFSFDIALNELNNINLLPHFVYYTLLLFIAFKLYGRRKISICIGVLSTLASVFGSISHYYTIRFYDNFTLSDLLKRPLAQSAYRMIENFAIVEALFACALAVTMLIGYISFIKANTGVDRTCERYSRTERDYHKRLTVKAILMFSTVILIFAAKLCEIMLTSKVQLIWSDDITKPVVEASVVPWFGTLVFALSVLLVFFSFYFIGEVKEETKLKALTEDK
jgi:hypothetical protein